MELKQINAFLKVAEELHFSKAAAALGLAQSALSTQIKSLEAELGCALFNRDNKWRVELTAAGEALKSDARHLLRQADDIKHRAKMASRGDIGRFSLCSIPSFFRSEKIVRAIREMQKKYPQVFLEILENSSEQILKKVLNDETDFGIIRIPNPAEQGLQSITLGRDKILLAVSADNPLARCRKISIADLRATPFIMLARDESPFFRQSVDALCLEKCGFAPYCTQEVYNFELLLKMLPKTRFATFIPEAYRDGVCKSVAFRDVSGFDLFNSYSGVWKAQNKSPILKNFIKMLCPQKTA